MMKPTVTVEDWQLDSEPVPVEIEPRNCADCGQTVVEYGDVITNVTDEMTDTGIEHECGS